MAKKVWVARGSLSVFSTEAKALDYLEKCRQRSIEHHRINSVDKKVSEIIKWKDGSCYYYKSGSSSVAVKKKTVNCEV